MIYSTGAGVDKNYQIAINCFLASAKQGYPQAQYNLGLMIENGHGVEANAQQALFWYQQAAKNNFEPAKQALSQLQQKTTTTTTETN
jgi:TPR repeat protein